MLHPQKIQERMRQRIAVDPTTGCHVWTGWKTSKGYGGITLPGKLKELAHRVAYELANGPIPDGLQLDHLCRNRSCCNPDHLEAVTSSENTARGWAARREAHGGQLVPRATHCRKGHEYTQENTYVCRRGNRRSGHRRVCRACAKLANEAYFASRKALAHEQQQGA